MSTKELVIRISEADLDVMLTERKHSRLQINELQKRNSALVEENRVLVQRLKDMGAQETPVDPTPLEK